MFFDYEEYIKGNLKYSSMIQTIQKEVLDFMTDFHDDSRFISGWGHGYFCSDDGGRLIYDRLKPLDHKCSICGKVYTDYIYSSYFITMYRNEAVTTTVKAAILYKISGDKKYLNIVRDIIDFYSDNYKYFAIHAKDKINCDSTIDVGGAGKMMPQGLNEAIVAIRFINALEIVKESLNSEWLKEIKKNLFNPLYELLLPQKMHIHNISIWINSAFGVMGLFFGEDQWIREATDGKFNIYEQLNKGLTKSGLWYEGSIHYNFFAFEGLMNFLVFAKSYGYKIPQIYLDNVKDMLFAAYNYAFDNDVFPNPSDGWPNISLKTYSYVYFMGYKVYGEELLPLINHIQNGKLERGKLPLSEPYYYENAIPLEQLLFAADYEEKEFEQLYDRKSIAFMDFNCAMIRDKKINIFLKYGHQTQSHAHPDKMNIEIVVNGKVLTKDISNSGYGTKICNEWDRTIAAHNTCSVNGLSMDVTNQGKLLTFNDNCIEAECEAYDGVLYRRKIETDGESIFDNFIVKCESVNVIDWFFHFEEAVNKDNLIITKEDCIFNEYIMNVKKVQAIENRVVLENSLVKMEIYIEEGARLYLAETYNNPANKLRDTVIIRKNGRDANFSCKITAKG